MSGSLILSEQAWPPLFWNVAVSFSSSFFTLSPRNRHYHLVNIYYQQKCCADILYILLLFLLTVIQSRHYFHFTDVKLRLRKVSDVQGHLLTDDKAGLQPR